MHALLQICREVGASFAGLWANERLRHSAAQRRQKSAQLRQPLQEGAAPLRGVRRSRVHY